MDERYERSDSQTKSTTRAVEKGIGTTAGRQHGVISIGQLLSLGLTPSQVKYRVGLGRLHRLHQGVYAVGHRRLSRKGTWMGATLVADDVLLSHRSSAEAMKLLEPTGRGIDVTSPNRLRPRRGLTNYRSIIPTDERTTIDGIPATSLSRTLLDLAATDSEATFTRALRQAHFRRLTDSLSLPDLLQRYPRRRGNAIVRRVLDAGSYSLRTRSPLEDRFLEFLLARGLPRPETNATVELSGERLEVDCLWRSERLVVELDGLETHGTREALEEDRRRDGLLQAHSHSVHRITDRRLETDPDGIDRQLRTGLKLSPPAGRAPRALRGRRGPGASGSSRRIAGGSR